MMRLSAGFCLLLALLFALASSATAQVTRPVITADNAAHLAAIDIAGNGYIYNAAWEDNFLILDSTVARWRYDMAHPDAMPERLPAAPAYRYAEVRNLYYVYLVDWIHGMAQELVRLPVASERVVSSPDRRYLAVERLDKAWFLFDVVNQRITGKIPLPNVWQFSTDGRYVVSGIAARAAGIGWTELHLLNVETLAKITLKAAQPEQFPGSVAVSPDDRYVVTAEACPTMCPAYTRVTLWDAATGEMSQRLVEGIDASVVVFNPDNYLLAVASHSGGVQILYDWGMHVIAPEQSWLDGVSFSPSGDTLDYTADCYTYHWNFAAHENPVRGGYYCAMASPAGEPDDVLALYDDLSVIWQQEAGKLAVLAGETELWSMDVPRPEQALFSPDGNWLLLTNNITPHLYEARTGKIAWTFSDYFYHDRIEFSPDGRYLVVTPHNSGWSSSVFQQISILDMATWKLIQPPAPERGCYSAEDIAFSLDGTLMVTAGYCGAKLWDTRSWSLIRSLNDFEGETVRAVEFSPDGTLLALAGGSAYESNTLQSVVRLYAVGDTQALPPPAVYPVKQPDRG
jgi:WD40 repeat protein